jgi:hypothetical protein
MTYSVLTTETEKEKPLQQLENILKNISNSEPSSSDSEKDKLEKSIIKLRKEINQDQEKLIKGEGNKKEIIRDYNQKRIHESFLRLD